MVSVPVNAIELQHSNDLSSSSLSVNPECVSVFNELKLGSRGSGPKYIIYKISDDQKEIVVDEVGKDTDYDVFREKLIAKKEGSGKDRPSYAIYDVEFELGGGEGKRFVPVPIEKRTERLPFQI